MNRDIIERSSPFTKLMFSLFLFVVVFCLSVVVTEGLARLFHMSVLKIDFDLLEHNATSLTIYKSLQMLQSFLFFAGSSVVIASLMYGNPVKYLAVNEKTLLLVVLMCILLVVACIPFNNFINELNHAIQLPGSFESTEHTLQRSEKSIDRIYELFMNTPTIGGLIFNIFLMALIPAIGEELLFRGVLQQQIIDVSKNKHTGIIICSFIFAAIHFQFYTFLPRFILGMMFGYIFLWSRNIWYPVTLHFINNLMTLLYAWLQQNRGWGKDLDTIGTIGDRIWMLFISVAVMGVLIWFIHKMTMKIRSEKIQ